MQRNRLTFTPELPCPDSGTGNLFKKLSALALLFMAALGLQAQVVQYHLLSPDKQGNDPAPSWTSTITQSTFQGRGDLSGPGMMFTTTEICNNGIDDDGDGYTDEFDPDCPNYAPFACDGRLYQTLIEGAGSPNIFYEVFTSPVQFDTISNLTALGFQPGINSIGFNPVDNFIYGINPSNPYQMIRINANGNFESVGNISNIPVNSNYAGDIDGNGIYYITGGSRRLYRIDLNGAGPNYPATQVGGTLPAAVADIAFNPVDSLLYGWNGSLWVIDPQTGAMSNIGAAGTPMNSAGACYFNPQGELIIYENNPGRLAKVRLSDGFTTVLGSGLRVNGNDGCSCAFGIELTKAASVTTTGGNSVFTYTFTIFNSSVATLPSVTFSDTLLGGLTWASEPQNITGGINIGSTSITGGTLANFNVTNVAPGQSSFTIDVRTDNQSCAPDAQIPNQAYLTNLPNTVGGDVASDDPNTGAIGDATVVTVQYDQTPPTAVCQNITVQLDANGSATITAAQIDNGSSDNCGIGSLSLDNNNFSCSDVGNPGTVTLAVTDVNGNSSTCTATVTVEDNVAPTIACPADITVQAPATSCDAVVNYTAPVGTDNCPGATTVQTGGLGSGSTFPNGTTTETYTVTDASGNTASCSFDVTVIGGTPPTIACPANITVNNDPGNCSAVVNYTVDVQGGCGSTTLSQTAGLGSGTAFPIGTTTESYTVTDGAGNTASCSFTVTVVDAEAPVVNCPADITVNNDPGICGAAVNYNVSFSDNCPGATLAQTGGLGSGSTFPVGTTTESYTATDAAGNTASCSFDVTVIDAEAPVVTCPADITVSNDAGICGAAVSYTVNYSDNCPGATLAQSGGLGSGATFPVGTSTESYTATDAAGNTASCSFTVTVNDTEAPVITCPANVMVECKSDIPAADANLASATDNCGIASIVHSGDSDNGASGCAGDPFVVTRTYTATDIYGNTASCTQTLTAMSTPIITTTSPNAIVFPAYQDSSCADISVVAMGGCPGYTYQWSNGATTASQNVCPTVTTVYTVTVTDTEGCTGIDSVKVCVIDITCTSQTNNGQTGNGNSGNGVNNGQGGGQGLTKLTICHVPPGNPANAMTKCLSPGAVASHISQHPGDYLGACGSLATRSCDFGVGNSKSAQPGEAVVEMQAIHFEGFPNPFRDQASLRAIFPAADEVDLTVYNLRGQAIAMLYKGSVKAGQVLETKFKPENATEGVYLVRLVTGSGQTLNLKLVMIR